MQITRRALGGSSLALCGVGCASATTAPLALDANLTVLSRLLGRWTGTGEGQPGNSAVERSYVAVLAGKFIEARNRSTYAPQAANPRGEVHDDLGYYSFDRAARRIVFRQFHVEGFVSTYAAPATSSLDAPFVMESQALENIPAGYRARETFRFDSPDAFEETFEIAAADKPFEVYARNRLRRA